MRTVKQDFLLTTVKHLHMDHTYMMYTVFPRLKRYFSKQCNFLCDQGQVTLLLWASEFLWLGYEMIDHLQTLGISGATVSWFIKIIENAAFSLKLQPRYKPSSDMMFLIFQISNHLLHNSQALGNMLSRVSVRVWLLNGVFAFIAVLLEPFLDQACIHISLLKGFAF